MGRTYACGSAHVLCLVRAVHDDAPDSKRSPRSQQAAASSLRPSVGAFVNPPLNAPPLSAHLASSSSSSAALPPALPSSGSAASFPPPFGALQVHLEMENKQQKEKEEQERQQKEKEERAEKERQARQQLDAFLAALRREVTVSGGLDKRGLANCEGVHICLGVCMSTCVRAQQVRGWTLRGRVCANILVNLLGTISHKLDALFCLRIEGRARATRPRGQVQSARTTQCCSVRQRAHGSSFQSARWSCASPLSSLLFSSCSAFLSFLCADVVFAAQKRTAVIRLSRQCDCLATTATAGTQSTGTASAEGTGRNGIRAQTSVAISLAGTSEFSRTRTTQYAESAVTE